jgi:hypothetical protein
MVIKFHSFPSYRLPGNYSLLTFELDLISFK